MPNNADTLNGLLQEVTREVDLGEYAEAFAGKKLQILVNPPCIVDEVQNKKFSELPRGIVVRVVALFLGESDERVARLDDTLLYWLATKSLTLYADYHDTLRKNSPAR